MPKETQIQLRVSLQKKSTWKGVAAARGRSLSGWLEMLADEDSALYWAEHDELEQQKEERSLLTESMYPYGKKNYEPDPR